MVCSVYMSLKTQTNSNIWSEVSLRRDRIHYECIFSWRLLSLIPFRVRLRSWMLLFSKQSSQRWAYLFVSAFLCGLFSFFASQKCLTSRFKSVQTFPCLTLLSPPSPRTFSPPFPSVKQIRGGCEIQLYVPQNNTSSSEGVVSGCKWQNKVALQCYNEFPSEIDWFWTVFHRTNEASFPWHFQLVA